MQRNNGDMNIQSSTYVSFKCSASTTYFQYIHLPVCQLPVRVNWVRALREPIAMQFVHRFYIFTFSANVTATWDNHMIFKKINFILASSRENLTLLHVPAHPLTFSLISAFGFCSL